MIFSILRLLSFFVFLYSGFCMLIYLYQEHRYQADRKSGVSVVQWRFPNEKWFKRAFIGLPMSLYVFGASYFLEKICSL